MKYCINYSRKSLFLTEADEINLEYTENLKLLLNFLSEHKEQRINLCIHDHEVEKIKTFIEKKQIKVIGELKKDFNIAVRFPYYMEDFQEQIEYCKKNNIPFYFKEIITTFDDLRGYIKMGVSDVIVAEEICFFAEKISKIAKKNNVRVHMYPNVAQSSWTDEDNITKFFIRPEDITFYESYVDVLEIFGESASKIDTTLDIYKNIGSWEGNLDILIEDFNEKVYSPSLSTLFGQSRVSCHKKCGLDGSCQICHRLVKLSKQLQKEDYKFDFS